MKHLLTFALMGAALTATSALADDFTLTSTDIAEGENLTQTQVFNGFGCNGGDTSPALAWTGAPEGTRSYALTVYDPDAPTGSGWWHWVVYNIPADVTAVDAGAGAADGLPEGAVHGRNDYGGYQFGGACPPPGEVHRYQFRIVALGVETLDIPDGASSALIGFMINANALDEDTITATYTR